MKGVLLKLLNQRSFSRLLNILRLTSGHFCLGFLLHYLAGVRSVTWFQWCRLICGSCCISVFAMLPQVYWSDCVGLVYWHKVLLTSFPSLLETNEWTDSSSFLVLFTRISAATLSSSGRENGGTVRTIPLKKCTRRRKVTGYASWFHLKYMYIYTAGRHSAAHNAKSMFGWFKCL